MKGMKGIRMLLRARQHKQRAAPEVAKTSKMRVNVPDHENSDGAMSMEDLAHRHMAQGDYEAAEKIFREELKLSEKRRGPEHPASLVDMNNLGTALMRQHKYEASEKIFRQQLKTSKEVLGPEHPITLGGMNSLAVVLCSLKSTRRIRRPRSYYYRWWSYVRRHLVLGTHELSTVCIALRILPCV